ncbi:hypothetical protein KX928_11780 [Roseobacter sp. YSTF-M11]|uniref:Dihydroorotate dehydrogenase n=2 Tax=Roseobacter insulae TaxID=2859783 RepID=A0A9X1K2F1_9RHOB|nr:hypothetical protein [Roseobacter insulae]
MTATDRMLEAARRTPPDVPARLMARVLEDADALQPAIAPAMAPHPALWRRIAAGIGGWQGVGGLVAATCAGIWIGVSPPAAIPDAGAYLLGYEMGATASSTAELTSFGWDLDEG